MVKILTNNARKMAGLPMKRRRPRLKVKRLRHGKGGILRLRVNPPLPEARYVITGEVSKKDSSSITLSIDTILDW